MFEVKFKKSMYFFKFRRSIRSFVSLGVIFEGMASTDDQSALDLFRRAENFAWIYMVKNHCESREIERKSIFMCKRRF